jgi:hypothetical protein
MVFDPEKFEENRKRLPGSPFQTTVPEPTPEPTTGFSAERFRKNLETLNSLDSNARLAAKTTPEEAARVETTANNLGLRPETVKNKPEEVKARQIQDSFKGASPLVRKMLEDVSFASQAHDDIENLSWLEKTFSGFGTEYKESFAQFVSGIKIKGLDDILSGTLPGSYATMSGYQYTPQYQAILDKASDGEFENIFQEGIEVELEKVYQSQERVKAAAPDDLGWGQEMVRSGVMSLAVQAPLHISSLLMRTPAPSLAGMGMMSRYQSYADARAEGLSPEMANAYSAIQAGIEVGTELAPGLTYAKALDKIPKDGFLNWFKRFAAEEMVGEQVATLGQSLTDIGFGLDKQMEQADTLEEKVMLQAYRQWVTAGSTLVAGGGQSAIAYGTAKGLDSTVGRYQRYKQTESFKTLNSAQKIAALLKGIDKSKMTDDRRGKFKQYVKDLGGKTGDETLYLDADQTSVLLQSEEITEEMRESEAYRQIVDAIPEARESGVRIEIPTELLVDIADAGLGEMLQPHMTLDNEALTPHEAQSENVQEEINSLIAMDEQQRSEEALVYNDVMGQLIGQMDRTRAEKIAILQEAVFRTQAARTGRSVQELYEQYGPQFRQEIDQALQRRASVDIFDIALDRLRGGDVPQDKDIFGQSLLEFIREQGGLSDIGGELAARDADIERVGRNRLVRPEGRSLDDIAELALESGFITERSERALLDAIDREVSCAVIRFMRWVLRTRSLWMCVMSWTRCRICSTELVWTLAR